MAVSPTIVVVIGLISGQFKATSPDLTLNGGFLGNNTKLALNWELKLFQITPEYVGVC